MTIRVLVGEDSPLAREGILHALDGAEDVDVVGACDNLDALREVIDAEEPDVVLTDIRMPPTKTDEGIRLAAELRHTHPRVGVVILSNHAEVMYAATLFSEGTGGRGYLLKDQVKDRTSCCGCCIRWPRAAPTSTLPSWARRWWTPTARAPSSTR